MKTIFENPFTDEKLSELYTKQKLTGTQLAHLAAEIMGWQKVPCANTAMSWVKQSGIKVRSSSENRKIDHAKANPARRDAIREQFRVIGRANKGKPAGGKPFSMWTPEERAHAMRARRPRSARVKKCEYICRVCMAKFERYRCQLKGKRFAFCSEACVGQFMPWYNSLPRDFREALPPDVDENGQPHGT